MTQVHQPWSSGHRLKANLTFAVTGTGLLSHCDGTFEFEPDFGRIEFFVQEREWVVYVVHLSGPRRLRSGVNSDVTRGYCEFWPDKGNIPEWLLDIIKRHGVHQYPHNY